MKLYATLLVKNEIDIIHQNINHHLPLVDKFYILDHNSSDGTWEYLQCRAKSEPKIVLQQELSEAYNQSDFVTNLILRAKADGADWVLNIDADEFLKGTLQAVLNLAATTTFNAFRLNVFNYRLTSQDNFKELNPLKRLTYKDKNAETQKVFIRTKNFINIGIGGHGARFSTEEFDFIPTYLYFDHYPYRSFEHFCRKIINGSKSYFKSNLHKQDPQGPWVGHWLKPYKILLEKGTEGLKEWFLKNIYVEDVADLVYSPNSNS